jgi:nitrogen fixation NifU-like protein
VPVTSVVDGARCDLKESRQKITMDNTETQNDFDRFVQELQDEIVERERALYSAKAIEEAHNPKNLGRLPAPDACAIVQGWCGDTMEIYLMLEKTRIKKVTFMTDGCGPSVACGSMLTILVHGMSLAEAGAIKPEDLIIALGGLPEESVHCAELAVSALQQAIADRDVSRYAQTTDTIAGE